MPLVAEDLCVEFRPGRRVLDAVSAEFPPGTLTAILGPNGAGKSTLVRTLLGLVEPAAGRALLDAEPVAGIPVRRRASRLAYVSQSPDAAFAFSVRAVVALGRFAADRAASPAAVDAALRATETALLADEPLGVLSAGQRQRVGLARALAQLALPDSPVRPGTYLLADEPVSAMDMRHALSTLRLLSSLADSGLGVVAVLHDLQLVLRHARRVVVLDASGRLAAAGPTQSTLTPDLLARVFGVPFVDSQAGGVGRVLMAGGPAGPP